MSFTEKQEALNRLFARSPEEIERPDRCLIIAEVAQAHDGSLGIAHSFIDAIAAAGADAVKFQTHIAEAESTPAEPWRVKFSYQDATRYDYWRRMGFTEPQWRGLKEHADRAGLLFLSSPFSLEAVDLLDRLGAPAWKVASGEITNRPMLEAMMAAGKPIILSTGMSPLAEIDALVQWIAAERRHPLALLQCTSAYPCPPEKVGLNVMPQLRARFRLPVGLSDHSGKIFAGLAAVALGCDILEVHVTFSRAMFGPDGPASLTFDELAQLVKGVREIEAMRRGPGDKDALAAETAPLRDLFTKSVVARADLPAGAVLDRAALAAKKPGKGFSAERMDELLGKRLKTAKAANDFIYPDDVEDP